MQERLQKTGSASWMHEGGVDPKEYLQHQKAALGRLFQWLDTDGDRQIHETPHQQRRDSVAHAADLRRWNENHRTKSLRLGQKDSHAFACFANAGVKALCTSVHLQHPLCKENWA
ncbi:hypothetical protein EAH_00016980 [Eimeria acervulina]|uniref:Uncharacterized protein n=1 Tax=Eimeria acervulina TaxID=5801 RepID=U6G7M1_EIMAC|nr:hypothetical protein EAH_00016980 [Eimeria acervulina]CDI76251.1 hypothetical protein EAH_00016980 [Eimeria acervulina]